MVIPLDDRLPGRSSGLTRGLRAGRPSPPVARGLALLFGLAPGGVCRAGPVTRTAGALLPHRFTLTVRLRAHGGLFSVALSVGSPPLAVSQHPARRCPDFPPARYRTGDHPAPSGARLSKSVVTSVTIAESILDGSNGRVGGAAGHGRPSYGW